MKLQQALRALAPLALLFAEVVTAAEDWPQIDVYTSASCVYCKSLRGYLNARGIPFTEHNINATLESREAFHRMGALGTPLTVINGQWIYGFAPMRIESAVRKARNAAAAGRDS